VWGKKKKEGKLDPDGDSKPDPGGGGTEIQELFRKREYLQTETKERPRSTRIGRGGRNGSSERPGGGKIDTSCMCIITRDGLAPRVSLPEKKGGKRYFQSSKKHLGRSPTRKVAHAHVNKRKMFSLEGERQNPQPLFRGKGKKRGEEPRTGGSQRGVLPSLKKS